ARRNIGAAPATCTRDTMKGLADKEVISQPAPTSCIHVPMLDAMLASHRLRNSPWRSGCQAEVVGGCSLVIVLTIFSLQFAQEWPTMRQTRTQCQSSRSSDKNRREDDQQQPGELALGQAPLGMNPDNRYNQ